MKAASITISNQGKKSIRSRLFETVVSNTCNDLHQLVMNYHSEIKTTLNAIKLEQGKLQ